MLGKMPKLKVVLTRNKENGPLKAFVEQEAADGVKRGVDLIKGQRFTSVTLAKHYVQFIALGQVVPIEWVVEEGGVQGDG